MGVGKLERRTPNPAPRPAAQTKVSCQIPAQTECDLPRTKEEERAREAQNSVRMHTNIADLLAAHSVFGELSPKQQRALAERADLRTVRTGEPIFTESESASSFFLIFSGEVRISKGGVQVANVGRGEILGSHAVAAHVAAQAPFGPAQRGATATALRDLTLVAEIPLAAIKTSEAPQAFVDAALAMAELRKQIIVSTPRIEATAAALLALDTRKESATSAPGSPVPLALRVRETQ